MTIYKWCEIIELENKIKELEEKNIEYLLYDVHKNANCLDDYTILIEYPTKLQKNVIKIRDKILKNSIYIMSILVLGLLLESIFVLNIFNSMILLIMLIVTLIVNMFIESDLFLELTLS